jgi:hypothetical protein
MLDLSIDRYALLTHAKPRIRALAVKIGCCSRIPPGRGIVQLVIEDYALRQQPPALEAHPTKTN